MLKHKLLIVEDSEDERILLGRSFDKTPDCEVITSLPDALGAIDYLSGAGAFADRDRFPFPDVVVMDCNMPRMSALEFLQWFHEKAFEGVIVIVMSNLFQDGQSDTMIARGAKLCLVKSEAAETAKSIMGFLGGLPGRT
jgi:CheY-like chemotaxis protein